MLFPLPNPYNSPRTLSNETYTLANVYLIIEKNYFKISHLLNLMPNESCKQWVHSSVMSWHVWLTTLLCCKYFSWCSCWIYAATFSVHRPFIGSSRLFQYLDTFTALFYNVTIPGYKYSLVFFTNLKNYKKRYPSELIHY